MKEVPTYKMISQSILIERMKVNGSLARKAMRHLEAEGLIKKVVHHHGQWVYSESLGDCGGFLFSRCVLGVDFGVNIARAIAAVE
jgi:DNA-binding transcriptional MocR family regulator